MADVPNAIGQGDKEQKGIGNFELKQLIMYGRKKRSE